MPQNGSNGLNDWGTFSTSNKVGEFDEWDGFADILHSPIVLNFSTSTNDVELTDFDTSTTYFDIDNDGLKERVSWITGPDQAFLVRDTNSDGVISSQSELFGNAGLTDTVGGNEAVDGFAKLAELDSDNNGKVDSLDSAWNELQLWFDTNGNGITDAGELQSLANKGVEAFDVDNATHFTALASASSSDRIKQIEDDGWLIAEGTVTLTGSNNTMTAQDVAFRVDTSDTQDGDKSIDNSNPNLSVANVVGRGQLANLNVVAESGSDLEGLLNDLEGTGFAVRDLRSKTEEILVEWTGSDFDEFDDFFENDTVESGSRLHEGMQNVLEQYFGFDFFVRSEYDELIDASATTTDASIHAQKAWLQPTIMFTEMWERLVDDLTVKLAVQTKLKNLGLTYNSTTDSVVYDGSDAVGDFRGMADTLLDYTMKDEVIADQIRFLDNLRSAYGIAEVDAKLQVAASLHGKGMVSEAQYDDTVAYLESRAGGHLDVSEASLKSHFTDLRDTDISNIRYWEMRNDESHSNEDYRLVALELGSSSNADERVILEQDTVLKFTDGSEADVDITLDSDGNDKVRVELPAGSGGVEKVWVSGMDSEILVGGDTTRLYLGSGTHTVEAASPSYAPGEMSISLDRSGVDLHVKTGPAATSPDGDNSFDFTIRDLSPAGGEGQRIIVEDSVSSAIQYKMKDSDDTILSAGGDDRVVALGGADLISGGGGDDSLYGGAGTDLVYGGDGIDQLAGGLDDDFLYGGDGNDIIRGGLIGQVQLNTGDDRLFGGNGDDLLNGDDGDDTLTGGDGADTIFGGDGVDYLIVENTANTEVDLNGGRVRVSGSDIDTLSGIEGVVGSDHADTLLGSSQANYLFGGLGADSLDGKSGADEIHGGTGDDQIITGAGSDTIFYHDDGGTDTVSDFTTSFDKIDLTGLSDVFGITDLTITDNGSDATISFNGADLLVLNGVTTAALSASDFIFADTQDGTSAADTLTGTEAFERIQGLDGADTISGLGGNDVLSGGAGSDVILAGDGDDTIDAGTGGDRLFGGDGADSLSATGDGVSDTLDGGLGDDTLVAGTGADSLTGGDGDDQLNGGAGNDTLEGGEGADTLTGGAGNDVFRYHDDGGSNVITDFATGDKIDLSELTGLFSFSDLSITDDGSDASVSLNGQTLFTLQGVLASQLSASDFLLAQKISGTSSDETLTGSNQNDWFVGSTGADLIDGYNGNDLIDGGNEGNTVGDVADTLKGWGGDDTIDGDFGDDLIYGGDGSDSLMGNAGEDTINGGKGDDAIFGSNGADSLIGSFGKDLIKGGAGNDTLDGGNAGGTASDLADTLYGEDGDDLLLGDFGNDSLFGGAGADTIYVDAGDDYADAGAGDDVLSGTSGTNKLTGGAGADTITAGSGSDIIQGGREDDAANDGADYINAGDGNDIIDANGGDDTVLGGKGADSIQGGLGADTVDAGNGDDTVFGSSGNDTVTAGNGADYVVGESGNDSIDGGSYGNTASDLGDWLYGGVGNDTLDGDFGNDHLEGGADLDELLGGAGDDYLNGGFGADTLTGGSGDDLFGILDATGADVITDFTAGAGTDDVIQIDREDKFADLTFTQVGNDVLLDLGGNTSVLIKNVQSSALHEDDFIFI